MIVYYLHKSGFWHLPSFMILGLFIFGKDECWSSEMLLQCLSFYLTIYSTIE